MPHALQSVLDDLEFFPDRQDRIEALIAYSDEYKHPSREEFPRLEEQKVPGCESEVYVRRHNDKFEFAVDNPQGISAMALAAILTNNLNSATKEEIDAIPDEVVLTIFGNELSMGKNLGLTNMVRICKFLAK